MKVPDELNEQKPVLDINLQKKALVGLAKFLVKYERSRLKLPESYLS